MCNEIWFTYDRQAIEENKKIAYVIFALPI